MLLITLIRFCKYNDGELCVPILKSIDNSEPDIFPPDAIWIRYERATKSMLPKFAVTYSYSELKSQPLKPSGTNFNF